MITIYDLSLVTVGGLYKTTRYTLLLYIAKRLVPLIATRLAPLHDVTWSGTQPGLGTRTSPLSSSADIDDRLIFNRRSNY